MFGEAIASGNCTNKACYNEKTDKKLESIVDGMKDEYQIVRIVRPGDNHTRIQISVEGASGVGEEQAKACHGCQNFGAAVSALPDSIGRVFSGQCFDTTCHSKKVAARLKAERDAKAAATQPKQGAKSAPAPKGSAASASALAEKAVTSISESEKVKAYRTGIWRLALRREVARSPLVANSYLVAIALTGLARDIKSDVMGKIFEKVVDDKSSATDLGNNLSLVADLAEDKRHNLTIGLTVAAIEGLEVNHLVNLCKHHKLDLRQHWNLQKSKDFLEMLTKAEMKVLADELGIRQVLGDGFAKLFNKSKPEVVEALLNVEGFDYTGKVPKVLCF
jgi:PRTRC genetic system ParB family protein